MPNRLQFETSPYLLQHAGNPVDWYPWGDEAFRRATEEDKPVFLSIGYSTCHWCHVMAHESFEDPGIAALLNRDFIAVKVDREERPDVDQVYMAACQAMTGSGGWPLSVFLTPEKKPFFAGTYFPKHGRGGVPGFGELLEAVAAAWKSDRDGLLRQADWLIRQLQRESSPKGTAPDDLPGWAAAMYRRSYDRENGGFGRAPKFPAAHNLQFLLAYGARRGDAACLDMAEHTLVQMYRGGLFDHVGGGFCRYSTDARFLVPHFEKMLYDNALLILTCAEACAVTGKGLYRNIAERTAAYVLRELTGPEGGFFCAQDADSDGEEGKYYLFTPRELHDLLGEADGEAFCRRFGVTEAGNFEGKNIPNLLDSDPADDTLDFLLPKVRAYRAGRCTLHLDDKVLTAWNGLMIAALCRLYRVSGNAEYLAAAERADRFLRERVWDGDRLYAGFRAGKRGVPAFLDDYAALIFAQLGLYAATLDAPYLERAERLCEAVLAGFRAPDGGFFLSGEGSERLPLRPRETYDGAMPSGNGLMGWNLTRLALLTGDESYEREAERQLDFLAAEAGQYPTGYAMTLLALLDRDCPPPKVTAVLKTPQERETLLRAVPPDAVVRLLPEAAEYPLKNGASTFYVCRDGRCFPPSNDLSALFPSVNA